MLDILTDICQGRGKEGDIELLEEIGMMMQKLSLCGLGTSAPNPVLTNILYFRNEYEAHIRDKKCPAGVCKPLFHYDIDPESCTGCHVCFQKCPQQAVSGDKKKAAHHRPGQVHQMRHLLRRRASLMRSRFADS